MARKGMGLRARWAMRRRCYRIAASLPLVEPFNATTLCGMVGQQRGREIVLLPMSRDDGILGVCWAEDDVDFIAYEERTTPPHQDHIILHELSHILCGHEPSLAEVFPGIDVDRAREHGVFARRAECSQAEEQEAELLASEIRQRAGLGSGRRLRLSGSNRPEDRLWTAMGG